MNRRQKKKFKKKLGYKKYSSMRHEIINKCIEKWIDNHPEYDCCYSVISRNQKHIIHLYGLKLKLSIPDFNDNLKQNNPKEYTINFSSNPYNRVLEDPFIKDKAIDLYLKLKDSTMPS